MQGARTGRADGRHPHGPVRLVAVLGAPDSLPDAVVDEQTTVAGAYAMAQFTEDGRIGGNPIGVRDAAAVSHNLADVRTGGVAPLLAAAPNGDQTSTLPTFNALANALAGCVGGPTCDELLAAAARPGRPAPTDTFQALVEIARAPGVNVPQLFALAGVRPLFAPALGAAPTAWTLALRYQGNGRELDGPGNIAFDAQGDAWVVNNYRFDPDPHQAVCGGRALLRFTPDGRTVPGSPYRGGGVYGAGFGVAIDPTGDVWAGNFGFQGRGCPLDPSPLYRSVSQFTPDGAPLSPRTGWQVGGIVQPQGMATDHDGTVWVANCGGRSVTRIPYGDPARAQQLTAGGALVKPFGITVDAGGRVWASGNGSDSVVALNPDGSPDRVVTGGGLDKPMGEAACPPGVHTGEPISPADTGYTSDALVRNTGVQVDPSGNVWLTNNWQTVPLQTNPGGHELVVFVGLAAPVRTPLIGAPQRP